MYHCVCAHIDARALLDAGGNTPGPSRFKASLQCGWGMGVGVIRYEHNLLDIGILFLDQDAQLFGAVRHNAPFSDMFPALAGEQYHGQEEAAGPLACVLIVLPLRVTRRHGQSAVRSRIVLFADLNQADDRTLGIAGTCADREHVSQRGHSLRRRFVDAPGLHRPPLEFVFLGRSRTVTWLMDST